MNTTKQLYQWDINQMLVDCTGLYVDFQINGEIYRVETKDGECLIPDEFLQTGGRQKIWECMPDCTRKEFVIEIKARPMPPDYAFTPTEKLTFDGLVKRVDDAIADMIKRADSGEFDGYTPVKGKDYFTADEIKQIQDEVSSGAVGDFKSVVDTKTETFNINAETKLNEFNVNAESNLTEYNDNATEKLNAYNSNAEIKVTEYNQNDTNKTAEYNSNAETKIDEYNTNANNRVAEFDSHTEQIQADISGLKSDLSDVENIIFTSSYPPVNVADIPNIEKYEGYNANAKTNGIEVLEFANFDSYVIVADHNCDIYVEETIPSSEYYSITIGKNYTGKDEYSGGGFMLLSSDSARYRNLENNLPTESNKLTINTGDVIAFTFLKGKSFTLNGYVKVKTPKNFNSAGYATKTESSLVVTVGKLRVVINKYNDSSIRAVNLWRANDAYIKASNGEFTRLWYNSDSDGVVKIKDEDDFIGGYHGDETQTAFRLFIDGIEYSEESTFTDLDFNELVIYCESEVYHCNTSSNSDVMAFKRNKIITFNSEGYSVSNYWVAQEDLTIAKAYMGMLSIERYTDNNYTDYLINGYHTNNDFTYVNADTGTPAQSDITEVVFNTIYGDVGIKISDIKTVDNYSYYGNVTNYNSNYDKRLKAYLANIDSNSGKSISAGTVIKAKATTFVR